MSLSKKNIVKHVAKDSFVTISEASSILEKFLIVIKSKSKSNIVKLSGFGTFSFKKSPERIGRNPKTKDSYIIPELNKFNFKPSKKIRDIIN
tara:strand:+ start:1090 stop:1365 length:276 start_codon:yes stop_codon:yes gene_type:complete